MSQAIEYLKEHVRQLTIEIREQEKLISNREDEIDSSKKYVKIIQRNRQECLDAIQMLGESHEQCDT